MGAERKKAKSPYQKYGKTPFKYSKLEGLAHQQMLVREFGAGYWIKVDKDNRPVLDTNGCRQRMFPYAAYDLRSS